MSDELMHWWSNGGATHAVANVTDWRGSDDPAEVTCPTCLEHIRERSA